MNGRFAPMSSGLIRDRRGTSVIEFGAIIPVIAVMIIGVTDLSRAFAARYKLTQAVNRAMEKVEVGNIQTDYAYLKPDVSSAAGIAQANVTITNWLECDGTAQTDFGGTCGSGATTARFVKVSAVYNFTPMFSYGWFTRKSDGTVDLTAKASMRVQ